MTEEEKTLETKSRSGIQGPVSGQVNLFLMKYIPALEYFATCPRKSVVAAPLPVLLG